MPKKMREDFYQPQLPPPPGWLTPQEAAERLGLSAITVRAWARSKLLTYGYIGTMIYISEESVADYARNRRPPHRPKSSGTKV